MTMIVFIMSMFGMMAFGSTAYVLFKNVSGRRDSVELEDVKVVSYREVQEREKEEDEGDEVRKEGHSQMKKFFEDVEDPPIILDEDGRLRFEGSPRRRRKKPILFKVSDAKSYSLASDIANPLLRKFIESLGKLAKEYCCAVFLDVFQVFGKVWHEGLKSKLRNYATALST